jgi:hypothetical protein
VVYSGKASGCPVCESVDKQSCKVTLQHVLWKHSPWLGYT